MATSAEMLIGGIGMFIVSLLRSEWAGFELSAVANKSWIGLIYLAVVGSLGGFVSYAYLLKNAPISLVSTYAFVNPIVALFLGAVFAHETLNGRTIIAATVILGAVILITTGKRISKQSKSKPTREADKVVPSN
jgi:drug/metabolite transporter (DMT)-like permease